MTDNCEFCYKKELDEKYDPDHPEWHRETCGKCGNTHLCAECSKECYKCYETICPNCWDVCDYCGRFYCPDCTPPHLIEERQKNRKVFKLTNEIKSSDLSAKTKRLILENLDFERVCGVKR